MIWTKDLKSLNNSLDIRMTIKTKVERIKNINGNANIYENYNVSEQHLDEIKNKWSREKFLGDDDELKNAIDTIRDGFHERKIYTNEEKYLDIIKNNNYNVDGYDNAKK